MEYEYQLIDHGIDHEQYFPGCGVSFTRYNHVVTGIGNTFTEALDDALDSLALDTKIDVEQLRHQIEREQGPLIDGNIVMEDMEDNYYYVSIRWNEPE